MMALSPTRERADVSESERGERGKRNLNGISLSPDSLSLVSTLPRVGGRANRAATDLQKAMARPLRRIILPCDRITHSFSYLCLPFR
jgi:hypothetical protein